MKNFFFITGLVLALTASMAMAEKSTEADGLQRVIVKVETITCGGCFSTINTELKGLEGFSGMGANLFRKLIAVDFVPPLTAEKISASLEAAGYPGRVESVEPVTEKESFVYLQSRQNSFQSCGSSCSTQGLEDNRPKRQISKGGSCCSLSPATSPAEQPSEKL